MFALYIIFVVQYLKIYTLLLGIREKIDRVLPLIDAQESGVSSKW